MRFMMLVKADPESEAGVIPDEALHSYNEELVKAGVLLAAEELHPTSRGARVRFAGDRRTVADGPFPAAPERVAGFWLIQVKSREEAVEWAKRCPNPAPGGEIEIREVLSSHSRSIASPKKR